MPFIIQISFCPHQMTKVQFAQHESAVGPRETPTKVQLALTKVHSERGEMPKPRVKDFFPGR
jgi:hypothetical protein